LDSAISKIQACKTADELFAVTNALLTEVERISSAARVMPGPKPIRSASDLRVWLRELKAAADPESPQEARDVFAQLFSWLRAAGRKLDAIGYRD
jgi:hypothetical protein